MLSQNIYRKVLIVGDRLKNFSNHDTAITISELEKLIESESINGSESAYIISVGQGICEKRLKKLNSKILSLQIQNRFNLLNTGSCKKSNTFLTHKLKTKNIMISNPIKITDNYYESTLMLDDSSAEMSDHVTGKHLQGMVLIEAARQMVIAVTKKYFISENKTAEISFVTHNTNANFHEFIFPIPIVIKYEVLEIKKAINNNLTSKSRITFIQNDDVSAEIYFRFSALCSKFVNEKENSLSRQSIEKYLKNNKNI